MKKLLEKNYLLFAGLVAFLSLALTYLFSHLHFKTDLYTSFTSRAVSSVLTYTFAYFIPILTGTIGIKRELDSSKSVWYIFLYVFLASVPAIFLVNII